MNRRTGRISVYHPLVVDQGMRPAVRPAPPRLRRGDVVGIWFGFNGDTLTLEGARGSLTEAVASTASRARSSGSSHTATPPRSSTRPTQRSKPTVLTSPSSALGRTAPCPTVRDFGVVDQDQSDNGRDLPRHPRRPDRPGHRSGKAPAARCHHSVQRKRQRAARQPHRPGTRLHPVHRAEPDRQRHACSLAGPQRAACCDAPGGADRAHPAEQPDDARRRPAERGEDGPLPGRRQPASAR